MSEFKAGDLIRVKRRVVTNWGWNYEAGEIFAVNRKGDLAYFDFFRDENEYFEKIDVETYGRHHTGYFVNGPSRIINHFVLDDCLCNYRGSRVDTNADYHGKHRYEDLNVWYGLSVAPHSNFAWR